MNKVTSGEIARLIALVVLTLLEGVALLSVALRIVLLPLGDAYPRIVSAVVVLVPILVGLLSRRWEAAVLLGVLPFWVMGIIYQLIYVPVWNLDLLSIGNILSPFVSVSAFALGLSYLGWVLRRWVWQRVRVSHSASGTAKERPTHQTHPRTWCRRIIRLPRRQRPALPWLPRSQLNRRENFSRPVTRKMPWRPLPNCPIIRKRASAVGRHAGWPTSDSNAYKNRRSTKPTRLLPTLAAISPPPTCPRASCGSA